jgi:hypothetical protein
VFIDTIGCTYVRKILQPFCNSFCKEEIFTFGKTHVAVGFVDLGILLYGRINNTVEDSNHEPMRFIGYEASAYCAARTLIIAEMFRCNEDAECIMQVWYSSAWTNKTKFAFLNALNIVVSAANTEKATEYTPEVTIFFMHWLLHAEVSLETSRKLWLESQATPFMMISNFVKKEDRMALCYYHLSGELKTKNEKNVVGNVTMFSIPNNSGDLALDLSFLQTIMYEILVNEWLLPSCKNIVEAGTNIILRKIIDLKTKSQSLNDRASGVRSPWPSHELACMAAAASQSCSNCAGLTRACVDCNQLCL